jgi:hypothetical protein
MKEQFSPGRGNCELIPQGALPSRRSNFSNELVPEIKVVKGSVSGDSETADSGEISGHDATFPYATDSARSVGPDEIRELRALKAEMLAALKLSEIWVFLAMKNHLAQAPMSAKQDLDTIKAAIAKAEGK